MNGFVDSAAFLDSLKATNLSLAGNPCHEEELEIAKKVGSISSSIRS